MFVCEVCLSCAYELCLFIVSLSCLRNLILHAMSTAASSVKKMQTADRSAVTEKLVSSGQMLLYVYPTVGTIVVLNMAVLA